MRPRPSFKVPHMKMRTSSSARSSMNRWVMRSRSPSSQPASAPICLPAARMGLLRMARLPIAVRNCRTEFPQVHSAIVPWRRRNLPAKLPRNRRSRLPLPAAQRRPCRHTLRNLRMHPSKPAQPREDHSSAYRHHPSTAMRQNDRRRPSIPPAWPKWKISNWMCPPISDVMICSWRCDGQHRKVRLDMAA